MKHIYYIGVYLIIQQYQKLCSLARALIHRHLLYGKNLEFVDSYKYLGVTVVAGKIFSTSHLKPLIKFQSAADTVLNVNREPSEQILMKMLYATCIPHLTYASDVVQYSTSQMHSMNMAVNDCIRRLFTFNRWESERYLRQSFGYPSLSETFEKRSSEFFNLLLTEPYIEVPTNADS